MLRVVEIALKKADDEDDGTQGHEALTHSNKYLLWNTIPCLNFSCHSSFAMIPSVKKITNFV